MKFRIVTVLLILCLVFSGCGRKSEAAFSPEESARLSVFTSHKQSVYEPIIREFEARTGIWVEVETGTVEDLLEHIGQGTSDYDVLFGGSPDQLEAVDCAIREAWFPVSSQPLVLIYNPKLVRQNLPQGWASLTDAAWSGKVAFPSPASQEGLTALTMLVQTGGDLQSLVENLNGNLLADSDQVVSAVAEGGFYIGIALEGTALAAIDAGLDVAVVLPEEGAAALTDGAAVLPDCIHEANAEKFAAFLQSGDVRRMLTSELHRRPAREKFETLTVYPEEILTQWQALWKEAAP